MAKWILEPGHTAVQFRVKHMMVSFVRGHIKNVQGEVSFDLENPKDLSATVSMDLNNLWTGESQRDKHLRSKDFFDAENHPLITFKSTSSEQTGGNDYKITGDLTIRGKTKKVVFSVYYRGKWNTPYYPESGDSLFVTRIGFTGNLTINRHDFGVSWNDRLDNSGIVVGHEVYLTLDAEALLESELR